MLEVLKLTDGTSVINLLNIIEGYNVDGWRQNIAAYKGGGVWQNSALSEGRRLVDKRFANVQEEYPIPATTAVQQDIMIRAIQDLLRLCEKASDFFAFDWQDEPVYLVSRARCETNTRYAQVHLAGVPQLGDIYSPTFLVNAVMEDLVLVVERDPAWGDNIPGQATCLEISGLQSYDIIQTTETESVPNSASDAELRRPNTFSIVGVDLVIGNDGAANDIGLRFDNVNVPADAIILDAYITFEATNNDANDAARAIIYGEAADDPAVFSTIQDFLARSKTTQSVRWPQTGYGTAVEDIVGTGIEDWTANVHYTTPDLTQIVQATVNRSGWAANQAMAFIINDDDSSANAQRRAAAWDHGADDEPELTIIYSTLTARRTYGGVATCDLDEVYIVNKHTRSPLTHIFSYSNAGAIWSANHLATAAPADYDLLPNTPVANLDAVYFGSQSGLLDTGPFDNLVFNIKTPTTYAGAAVFVWSTWTGAIWGGVTGLRDNTSTLIGDSSMPWDRTGFGSIHWNPPTNWAPTAVNGVTAFWIRTVASAPAGPDIITPRPVIETGTPPGSTQIHTVTWPRVTTEADEVDGDIPALIRVEFTNRSDQIALDVPDRWANRIIYGWRNVGRGSDFTAYINVADEGNHPGITVFPYGTGGATFIDYDPAPTGRVLQWVSGGVSALSLRAIITIDDSLAADFYGRFHLYLRGIQTAGNIDEIGWQVRAPTEYSPAFTSETQYYTATNTIQALDLGELVFPGGMRVGDTSIANSFYIYGVSTAAATASLFDLIIIPVDESAGDVIDVVNSEDSRIGRRYSTGSSTLKIDSITDLHRTISGVVFDEFTDRQMERYMMVASGPIIVQPDDTNDQHLWTLAMRTSTAGAGFVWSAEPNIAHTVQSYRVQRYLGPRGDR